MSTMFAKNDNQLARLRRRWAGVTAVWLSTWLLGWIGLRQIWPDYVQRWALFSGITLLVGLGIVWRNLDQNHRPGERRLLSTLGWGNQLSLMRGLAIGCVAGFLFSPWPLGKLGWIPVLLYTLADVADYFDGYIARKTHHATRLGETLDMEFDGLGMLVVSVLGVWYGMLPWWYVMLGLARYFFILGIWWRNRFNKPVYELHPSVHRRLFAGVQMGFMSAVLWPIIPAEATTIAGTIVALPTAVGFLRDWLVVSGRLDVENGRYQAIQQFLVRLTRVWLPPVWRLTLVICLGIIFSTLSNWLVPPPWLGLLQSWRVPLAGVIGLLLGISAWAGLVLVAAGAMVRLVSLVVVFPIGFDIASQGLTWASGLALASAVCLLLLGSGSFSLWQPEERFVLERLG